MQKKSLRIWIDTSGSCRDHTTWLPVLASVLREVLAGLGADEKLMLRIQTFSHQLAPDYLRLSAKRDTPVQEVLGRVYRGLSLASGGTDFGVVWDKARELGPADLGDVVLSDLEWFPGNTRSTPTDGFRYVQYGIHERPLDERLYDITEHFVRNMTKRFGAEPELTAARRPTAEQLTAEKERVDRLMEIIETRRAESEALAEADPEGYREAERDSAEIASDTGFYGTLREFFDWLSDSLAFGSVRVAEPSPDAFGHMRVEVVTVTGGFSSDEHLLGRVSRLPVFRGAWRSSHAGGRDVYEFAEQQLDWPAELKPEGSEPFEVLARARTVKVISADGETVVPFEGGVELSYEEPDFRVGEPSGALVIRPWSGTV